MDALLILSGKVDELSWTAGEQAAMIEELERRLARSAQNSSMRASARRWRLIVPTPAVTHCLRSPEHGG